VVRWLWVILRLLLLAIGRPFPVLPLSRLLDFLALLGITQARGGRPHVLVAGNEDFRNVLGDHTSFSVPDYARKMAVIGTFLLGRDFTPEYLQEIQALRRAMPPDDIEHIRDIATASARAAVLAAASHRLDVGQQLARPVLLDLVEKYFGVATGNPSFFDWFNTVSSYIFKPDVFLKPQAAADALSAGAAIRDHVGKETAIAFQTAPSCHQTVLSRLVSDTSAQKLACVRVRDTLAGTIAGGLIPAFQEFVQVIDVLLDLPPNRFYDVQTIARGGSLNLLLPYVLEAARFSPRPPLIARQSTRDVTLRGRSIAAGTVVLALPFTAAFDWKVAPWPWRFSAGRPSEAYPIFGHGQHHCPGASPTRPIAQVVMTAMAMQILALPGLRRGRGPLGRAGLGGARLFVEWD
jgi:cytochrome P450